MKLTGLMILLAAFALVAVPMASASTITLGPGANCDNLGDNCGNLKFVITATGTTASLSITNGNAVPWYLQYFSLNLYSGAVTATGNPSNTQNGQTFTIVSGNGNNGQPVGGCNSSGPASAFCVDFTTDGAIAAGATVTYNFNISGGTLANTSTWHLQTLLNDAAAGGSNSARVAISGGPGGTQVPEPSSMVLFGSGLLSVAGIVRRRFLG